MTEEWKRKVEENSNGICGKYINSMSVSDGYLTVERVHNNSRIEVKKTRMKSVENSSGRCVYLQGIFDLLRPAFALRISSL